MSRGRDIPLSYVNTHQQINVALKYACTQIFLYVWFSTCDAIAADQPNSLSAPLPSALQITLIPEARMVEHRDDGEHYRYVPAEHVAQGEEIYYTVRIENLGDEKLKHAVVVQPIPINTHLVERSVTGAGALITYSLDSGNVFLSATELRDVMDDNEPKSVRVTNIRWQFRHTLAPHVVVLARFRVVFD